MTFKLSHLVDQSKLARPNDSPVPNHKFNENPLKKLKLEPFTSQTTVDIEYNYVVHMTTSRNKRILLILSSIPHKESAQLIFLHPLQNLGRNFVKKNVKSIRSTVLEFWSSQMFLFRQARSQTFRCQNNALCIPTQGFLMRNKLVI